VFCDVSEQAYSAGVYLRIEEVHLAFVASKSRVAHLKQLTIPTMELMPAVLGTKLLTAVKKELMLPINSEILEATDVNSWKWGPTKLNPG
jgi:hypothetical protein